MTSVYEEVEIEDMRFSRESRGFFYVCPCGDQFFISIDDLLDGEDLASCPSCTLRVRVIYDDEVLDTYLEQLDEEDEEPSTVEPVESEAEKIATEEVTASLETVTV